MTIELFVKEDRNGDRYLVADPKFPAIIDLSKVVMLIWPHMEEGAEEYPTMIIKSKEQDRPKKGQQNNGDVQNKEWERG